MHLPAIITTSPIPSNPNTEMIEKVIDRLYECTTRIIIICDGFVNSDKQEFKSAKINAESANSYQEFIVNLKSKFSAPIIEYKEMKVAKKIFSRITKTDFGRIVFLEHSVRVGFALAVYTGLTELNSDENICLINQHDWILSEDIAPLQQLANIMNRNDDMNYVGFVSRRSLEYHLKTIEFHPPKEYIDMRDNQPFTKLYFWYDRPHLVKVNYYMSKVFKQNIIKRGYFIEDCEFCSNMVQNCKSGGWDAYGTWLWYPDNGSKVYVRHLNGRKYIMDGKDYRSKHS